MTSPTTSEMVPLAERLRYMQAFRLLLAGLVLGARLLVPTLVPGELRQLAIASAGYVAASAVGEVLWRLRRRRGLRLFGAMLLVDGLYVAWVTHLTGATSSPLRHAVLLHLIAVTLLASYRTGLKLALWHSMVAFNVFHATASGLLRPAVAAVAAPSSSYLELCGFVVTSWLVAVGTALASAVNERELRRRRFDSQSLADMARALEQEVEPQAAAQTLLDGVAGVCDFRRGVVLGATSDGPLRVVASREAQPGTAPPEGVDAIVERAWASRGTVLVKELHPERDRHLATLLPGARNLVVVPLVAETRAIGALVLERANRDRPAVERRVVATCEQFAAHAALALRNAWLLEEVRALADRDGLTGLANRRVFDATLARELARAARSGEPLSLLLVDIDHFKKLNDGHGHQTGDDVLRQVAGVLAAGSRSGDLPARYGGEEFVVVLPACPADEAAEVAERLRAAVAAADTTVAVTVSVGVATCPTNASGASALVGAADEALYASKRDGRNRVTASTRREAALVGAAGA